MEDAGSVKLKGGEEYVGKFRGGELYGECTYVDGKGRKNKCFMFGGRRLRSAVGLKDE